MQTTWEQDLGMPPLVSSNVIPVLTSTTQPLYCLPFLESTAPTKLLTKSSTEQIEDENRFNLNPKFLDPRSQIKSLKSSWRPKVHPGHSFWVSLEEQWEKTHTEWVKGMEMAVLGGEICCVCSTTGSTEKNSEVSTPASNTASLRNHL